MSLHIGRRGPTRRCATGRAPNCVLRRGRHRRARGGCPTPVAWRKRYSAAGTVAMSAARSADGGVAPIVSPSGPTAGSCKPSSPMARRRSSVTDPPPLAFPLQPSLNAASIEPNRGPRTARRGRRIRDRSAPAPCSAQGPPRSCSRASPRPARHAALHEPHPPFAVHRGEIRLARLHGRYHVEGETQEVIARALSLSRMKVNRMLREGDAPPPQTPSPGFSHSSASRRRRTHVWTVRPTTAVGPTESVRRAFVLRGGVA